MEIQMLLVYSTIHLAGNTLTHQPLSLAAYCNYIHMFPVI